MGRAKVAKNKNQKCLNVVEYTRHGPPPRICLGVMWFSGRPCLACVCARSAPFVPALLPSTSCWCRRSSSRISVDLITCLSGNDLGCNKIAKAFGRMVTFSGSSPTRHVRSTSLCRTTRPLSSTGRSTLDIVSHSNGLPLPPLYTLPAT